MINPFQDQQAADLGALGDSLSALGSSSLTQQVQRCMNAVLAELAGVNRANSFDVL